MHLGVSWAYSRGTAPIRALHLSAVLRCDVIRSVVDDVLSSDVLSVHVHTGAVTNVHNYYCPYASRHFHENEFSSRSDGNGQAFQFRQSLSGSRRLNTLTSLPGSKTRV